MILWSEQKCVAGNIMKNSKVYFLISVCSCFVIILKFFIFRYRYGKRRERRGEIMVWHTDHVCVCVCIYIYIYIYMLVQGSICMHAWSVYIGERLLYLCATEFGKLPPGAGHTRVVGGSAGVRSGWKLCGFERHLLSRGSWHFAFYTTMARVQSTNHRFVLIDTSWIDYILITNFCALIIIYS